MQKINKFATTKAIVGGILYVLLMEFTYVIYWFYGKNYDSIAIVIIMILLGLLYSSTKIRTSLITIALAFTTAVISIFIRIAILSTVPLLSDYLYRNFKPENFEVSPADILISLDHNINYILFSPLTILSAIVFTKIFQKTKIK